MWKLVFPPVLPLEGGGGFLLGQHPHFIVSACIYLFVLKIAFLSVCELGVAQGGSVCAQIAILKLLLCAAGIYLLIFYLGFFINIHMLLSERFKHHCLNGRVSSG